MVAAAAAINRYHDLYTCKLLCFVTFRRMKSRETVSGNAVPCTRQAALDQVTSVVNTEPVVTKSRPVSHPSVALQLPAKLPQHSNNEFARSQSSHPLKSDAVVFPDDVTVSSKLLSSQTSGVDDCCVVVADCSRGDPRPVPVQVNFRDAGKVNTRLSDAVVSSVTSADVDPALSTGIDNCASIVGSAVGCADRNENADSADADCLMEVCTDEATHSPSASGVPWTEDGQISQKVSTSPCTAASKLCARSHAREPAEDGTPVSSLGRHVAVSSKHSFENKIISVMLRYSCFR